MSTDSASSCFSGDELLLGWLLQLIRQSRLLLQSYVVLLLLHRSQQQELSSEAGRHLAYKEYGVLRDKAICKIVFVHGSDSCRHDNAFVALL
ncbi:hypothetical protein F2Q68_00008133 [Brassica cretica]|uniref:Uncharacterized protein n=1 Tax=Brassica cretica TaxID=69181 RepID=A0A8S9L152_BRACR|nr:hypothetical protein F2Q68_00008133 [Brassica cretica]